MVQEIKADAAYLPHGHRARRAIPKQRNAQQREAAEQTVTQKVVPYKIQGRVVDFATTCEAAAAPITAFMIAPLAEFWIIPYMASDPGKQSWGWLLGEGNARGIALVFMVSGIASIILGLAALTTRSYRRLSVAYAEAPESAPIAD